MAPSNEYVNAYRITLEVYSLQTGLRQNRVNVALLVNGGLLALAGSFRESCVMMYAIGIVGLLSNVLFLAVLSRLRIYLDLVEAQLRALEQRLPHVRRGLLEERLRVGNEALDSRDIWEALELTEPAGEARVLLRKPLPKPWLVRWELPLIGRIDSVRGLEQSFFLLLAALWPILAVVATVVA
jgi:hypothetical protein